MKRRAAPRMPSAALAAERPSARAGAAGAGRVNRCQHSTPDRVSRLTPPVSRHDRPKLNNIIGRKDIQDVPNGMDKSVFLVSTMRN